MKILISGDSWGKGEWAHNDNGVYGNTHPGLEMFLRDSGHEVYNISEGATNLYQALDKFDGVVNDDFSFIQYLNVPYQTVPKLDEYDYILLFVTDFFRGDPTLFEDFWIINNNKENVLNRFNQNKHYFLSKLNTYGVKIHLLGGLSKIHHDDVRDYENLEVLIPSVIDLLAPDIGAYEVFFNDALNSIYSSIPDDLDPDYVDYVYGEVTKIDGLKKNPFFSGDGRHPNRIGYKVLCEEILRLIVK